MTGEEYIFYLLDDENDLEIDECGEQPYASGDGVSMPSPSRGRNTGVFGW
jgi:hypothetical protein